MKVNLLQGTCTPTLTPMPGVHKPLKLTVGKQGLPIPSSLRSSAAA
jgi:hypothetical protein